jgi:hypothetical protein
LSAIRPLVAMEFAPVGLPFKERKDQLLTLCPEMDTGIVYS